MTSAVVNVMVEVLHTLAVVTKEIKQSRISESIPGGGFSLQRRLIVSQKLLGRSWLEEPPSRMHCKGSKQ